MKLTFEQFSRLAEPAVVTIHSLDQALYQVTVHWEGKDHLLVEPNGKTFRCHSLQQVREAIQTMPIASLFLRQQSAYDEMIGQPMRDEANTLEIPLSLDTYPPPTIH